jgi:hypothetical protein
LISVGQIPASATARMVRTALEQFGEVRHVFVRTTARGTHGFASFVIEQVAEVALAVGHAFVETPDGMERINLRRRENRQ